MSMRVVKALPVAVALVALAGLTAAPPAYAQQNSFKFFVTYDWISPLGDDNVTVGSVTDAVKGSDGFGYEGGFEWRLHKVVGLEASYLQGSNDFKFGSSSIGSLDQKALTAALNFHIIPTKHFDLWIAPVFSWYRFDNFEIAPGQSISLDDRWGYGGAVGLDIGITEGFAITAGVRYTKVSLTSSDSVVTFQDVAFDPVIARAGVAFRFGKR
jgi:outer membrane protein W